MPNEDIFSGITSNLIINSQVLEAAYIERIKKLVWVSSTTAYPEKEELLLIADQEGAFITDLTLVKGFNEITVIASNELTEPKTQNLIVTYSTTDIELETNQTDTEWKKPVF